MFIPRSARRIRLARAAFVLVGVLPCAGLVAWAVHRHSAGHRDAIRRDWEQALGLPLAIASVEHPLPGAVRVRDCSLAAADGRPVLAATAVDVETSPTEVRLRIGALGCDPAGAAVLAGLAGEWLWRGARFRRDVVIDVADFAWEAPGAKGRAERRPLGPVRIECVTQAGTRALRVVRRQADDGADEVRIVRTGGDGEGGDRVDIEASCTEPVPFPVVAAIVARGPVAGLPLGDAATVRGRLAASAAGGRWSGSASGSVERIDLATCTGPLQAGASGTLDVLVREFTWRDGRLGAAELACTAGAGHADRGLLEAFVTTLGCRAGAAYVGPTPDVAPTFDAAGCEVRIDGRGIQLSGSPRLGGALAVVSGRPLLEPPAGIVPPERLAWLLAPSGAVYVPSSGPGSWLMSLLPAGGDAAERTPRVGRATDGDGF